MTRKTIETLKRLRTHLEKEAERMTFMGKPYFACMRQRQARAVSECIELAKDITFLKGKNDE